VPAEKEIFLWGAYQNHAPVDKLVRDAREHSIASQRAPCFTVEKLGQWLTFQCRA